MVYTTEDIIAAEKCINEVRRATLKANQKTYYMKNREKIIRYSRNYYEGIKEAEKEKRRLNPDACNTHYIKITVVDTRRDEQFEYGSLQECARDMGFTPYRIYKNLKDRIPFDGYMFKRGGKN